MSSIIAPPLKNLNDFTAVAQGNFEELFKAGHEQGEKLKAQLATGYEEFATFSKGNVEAVVASGAVVAKGAEDLSKAYVGFAKGFYEQSLAASKALFAAKSPDEALKLSNDFAKASYEAFVAEAGKLQELSVQVANEAIAPLSARFTIAVEKFSKPLAA